MMPRPAPRLASAPSLTVQASAGIWDQPSRLLPSKMGMRPLGRGTAGTGSEDLYWVSEAGDCGIANAINRAIARAREVFICVSEIQICGDRIDTAREGIRSDVVLLNIAQMF